MLIVQISDLHITTPSKKAYGVASTGNNLVQCIDHINQLKPQPDLVLVTGDICNENSFDELVNAKALLDQLNYPYYVMPGNHDTRHELTSVFDTTHCPITTLTNEDDNPSSFINYVIEHKELRMIAVDSTIEGKSGGELCNERLAWLKAILDEDQHKPTIIIMHHPPIKLGVFETDIDVFIGTEKLEKLLKNYSNIKAILSGHIHRHTHTLWANTVVITAPSTSMELMLEIDSTQPSKFFNEPPSYLLHYWTSDKNLVSHAIVVHETNGPYPFMSRS